MGRFSAEDLAMLSEDELAGVKEFEAEADDVAATAAAEEDRDGAPAAAVAGAEDKEGAPATKNEDEGAAENAGAEKEEDGGGKELPTPGDVPDEDPGAAAAEGPADERGDEETAAEDEEPARRRAAVPDWAPPEKAEDRIKEIEAQRAAIDAKYDDGEIGSADWRKETRALDQQEHEIRKAVDRAEMAWDLHKAHWFNETVPDFLARHKMYADPDSSLSVLFDIEVKKLQEKSGDPFDPSHLANADKTVRANLAKALGQDVAASDPEPAKKAKEGGAAEKTKVKAGKPPIPPSFAKIPASAKTEVGDEGGFAALDRLSPEAQEAALAKLSDAELERYLMGN